jgi:ferredoxin
MRPEASVRRRKTENGEPEFHFRRRISPWRTKYPISMGDMHFDINPDRCTECVGFFDKPQCLAVCPNEAPGPDPAHKETKDELLAKKTRLHP